MTHKKNVNRRVAKQRIAIFGGRGGGEVVAESISYLKSRGVSIEIYGFLNDVITVGEPIGNSKVISPFRSWQDAPSDVQFIAPIHKTAKMLQRARLLAELGLPESRWCTIVDPRSSIADSVVLRKGVHIASLATIQPHVRIGMHTAVRSGASIGHESVVEKYVFVGMNATICGRAHVSKGAHIGPGACILEHTTIGRYAVIGMGSIVICDVPDFAVMAGNPAKQIGEVSLDDEISRASSA